MRGRPALTFFVPLEHGKICDPQKAKFTAGKRAMFGCIPLSQSNAQLAGRVVNRMIVLFDFRLHSSCRLVLSGLFASCDYDDEIPILGAGRFNDFNRGMREILLQPLEVLE